MSDNIEDFFSAEELDDVVYSLQRSMNEDGRRFYPFSEVRDQLQSHQNDFGYVYTNFDMILKVHTYCTKLFCTEQFYFLASYSCEAELKLLYRWFEEETSPYGIVGYQHYVGTTYDPKNRERVGRMLFSDNANLILFKLALGKYFPSYNGADREWAI